MNIEQIVNTMTPELYERLQYGSQTGRWPDGSALTAEQKEQALQLVILYQAKVEKSDQQFTVSENGEIVQKSKAELKKAFADESEIIRVGNNDL